MGRIKHIFSTKHQQLMVWTLLFLIPIVSMAVDLVSPSLPAIASSLNVPAGIVKGTISIYLFGYAFGNFFTGFLTDALGRQKLLRMGLIGFILVSILPILYQKIEVILLARLLQGLTIGSISVTARAIFSDIIPPEQMVQMGVVIGSMFGLGPIIGPFMGGYLQYNFGWQACFTFFAIITTFMFILVYFIVPETHLNRHKLKVSTIKSNILEIITHRRFMGMVVMMGSIYSLSITFNIVGPFLVQTKLHYSPIFFGNIALYLGFSFMLATFICRYLLTKYKVDTLFFISINSFLIIAILAVIIGHYYKNSITVLTIFSAIMFFAQGFLFPMSMGNGISIFRHIAGTATAIMYLINILITSLTAFILSFINIQTTVSLFWIYLVLTTCCAITYWKYIKK